MSQQLLDGSDVVAALKQVGGKRMPEGVTGGALSESRSDPSLFDGTRHGARMERPATAEPGLGIGVHPGGREEVLLP